MAQPQEQQAPVPTDAGNNGPPPVQQQQTPSPAAVKTEAPLQAAAQSMKMEQTGAHDDAAIRARMEEIAVEMNIQGMDKQTLIDELLSTSAGAKKLYQEKEAQSARLAEYEKKDREAMEKKATETRKRSRLAIEGVSQLLRQFKQTMKEKNAGKDGENQGQGSTSGSKFEDPNHIEQTFFPNGIHSSADIEQAEKLYGLFSEINVAYADGAERVRRNEELYQKFTNAIPLQQSGYPIQPMKKKRMSDDYASVPAPQSSAQPQAAPQKRASFYETLMADMSDPAMTKSRCMESGRSLASACQDIYETRAPLPTEKSIYPPGYGKPMMQARQDPTYY